jgi:hypothetical protein
MAKDQDGFIDFTDLDPEISETLRAGQRRQAARSKTGRAARQAAVDAKRNRRMIDIPEELDHYLEQIAVDLSIPVSQLITRLIWEGLEHLTIETLKGELKPTRSMRYFYTLPYPGQAKKGKSK